MSDVCIFCKIIAHEIPASVVYEDDLSIAFLDATPLFPGHVLLVPKIHVQTLVDLPAVAVGPFFENVQKLSRAVEKAVDAPGTFIGINNRISQSVPHLHVHIVPRRLKDGLRGFFWPKNPYSSLEHMKEIATKVRAAL
jgi:histidine triad (HIT) family protein